MTNTATPSSGQQSGLAVLDSEVELALASLRTESEETASVASLGLNLYEMIPTDALTAASSLTAVEGVGLIMTFPSSAEAASAVEAISSYSTSDHEVETRFFGTVVLASRAKNKKKKATGEGDTGSVPKLGVLRDERAIRVLHTLYRHYVLTDKGQDFADFLLFAKEVDGLLSAHRVKRGLPATASPPSARAGSSPAVGGKNTPQAAETEDAEDGSGPTHGIG